MTHAFPQLCCGSPVVLFAARDLDDGNAQYRAGSEMGYFREFVRPVEGPEGVRQLTPFCTNLTGIAQKDVASASTLAEVLERVDAWLGERGLKAALEKGTAVIVAHGNWDLSDQLPRECARKGIALPSYWNTYVDLKVVFGLACPTARGSSLNQMLEHFNLPPMGRAHSGIDVGVAGG